MLRGFSIARSPLVKAAYIQQRSFGNFVARTPVYDSREWEGNPAINDQVNVLNDIKLDTYYEKSLDQIGSQRYKILFNEKDLPPKYLSGLVDKSTNNTALTNSM
jgi:hypothetical protein